MNGLDIRASSCAWVARIVGMQVVLRRRLGRDPTQVEISRELGITQSSVSLALAKTKARGT